MTGQEQQPVAAARGAGAARDATGTVVVLIRPSITLRPDQPAGDAVEAFRTHPQLHSLPVVSRDRYPLGLLHRYTLLSRFATPYGHSLYAERPAESLIAPDSIIVASDLALESLSERITEQPGARADEDFIVVDEAGRYLGVGTVLDLLRRITELRLQSAQHANPLTGLPGNVPFSRRVEELLQARRPFAAIYCDIDDFKAYNDRYGYAAGDEIIQLLATLLCDTYDAADDFVSHIGGDDFGVVTERGDWHERGSELLARFDAAVPEHYAPDDRAERGIHTVDRAGNAVFRPFAAVSMAAVHVLPGQFDSRHAVAARLAEIKSAAKGLRGSVLLPERRRNG